MNAPNVRSGAVNLMTLAQRVRRCRRCPGLNEPGFTQGAPGYGDPNSPVMIVGQSLCGPCMHTQVPFTGGCGRILDDAFRLARIRKNEVFTTNVVHCHPPGNRPSLPEEIKNCSRFLARELALVRPVLVIGLGRDARHWLLCWAGPKSRQWDPSAQPVRYRDEVALLLVHHPSFIRRRPLEERNSYVRQLAQAVRWAFADTQPAP